MGCYKQPFHPAVPEPDSFSWLLEPSLRPRGLLPRWWTWQLLSYLVVWPVARLNWYSRHTHTQEHAQRGRGYSGCQRQGTVFNSIHMQCFQEWCHSQVLFLLFDWYGLTFSSESTCTFVDLSSIGVAPSAHPTLLPGSPYPPHGSLLASCSS